MNTYDDNANKLMKKSFETSKHEGKHHKDKLERQGSKEEKKREPSSTKFKEPSDNFG
eukprot:CAMPEP_0170567424 /NCGR_PEP_ID=MMETSP0211-20121228/80469_1 /TAXON_ID=311385 /ORGANISM="Pseudokeronopsis sp., Strain OXSARD2" /LENGTH=56 /DNA_ID=CAMNT_0010888875 /DNA_START=259 /DNA_END=429 /DNA_ORIENTATION=-